MRAILIKFAIFLLPTFISLSVYGQTSTLQRLEAKIAELEAVVIKQQASIDKISRNRILGLRSVIKRKGDTVIFEGVNVQIVNGSGFTNTVNGAGNLIVGYDESLSSHELNPNFICSNGVFVDQKTCLKKGHSWGQSQKSGSHNLVVGSGHSYTQSSGVVFGASNVVNGVSSVVLGGAGNTASGKAASISGGNGNVVSSNYSSISGGKQNTVTGQAAAILGGELNIASGDVSSISGGSQNESTALTSTISGGENNLSAGVSSAILGGENNLASGSNATVSGGEKNIALGDKSNVSGGLSNQASGDIASVAGGIDNTAAGDISAISGGTKRIIRGEADWVAGDLTISTKR